LADIVSEEQQAALARPESAPSPSRHKFGIAYLVLAAIVGAAVGLLVVLTTGHDDKAGKVLPGSRWSSWAPSATGTLGVRQIARHVSPAYRLSNGRQLAAVTAGPMQVRPAQGPVPVTGLLISSGISGRLQERIDVTFPDAGVFYAQCGRIGGCQPSTRPTVAEQVLLQREALELALYTFRYLPDADTVIDFLPPRPGVDQSDPRYHRAIYLPRTALTKELRTPLRNTLPLVKGGISPDSLSRSDADKVLGILAGHTFHYAYQQAPDSSALLQLTPIEP
jgi:hypothetical protein